MFDSGTSHLQPAALGLTLDEHWLQSPPLVPPMAKPGAFTPASTSARAASTEAKTSAANSYSEVPS